MRPVQIAFWIAGLAAASLAYVRLLRPRVLHWGSTLQEQEQAMPGDDILPDAVLQTTRSVTIDAPVEDVWPWLVQMGGGDRAGAYTYDWIERWLGIEIRNSDRILPEYQHLDVGQFLELNQQGTGLVVRDVATNKHLVLQWEPAQSTWTFALYPLDEGKTRLVSRNRLRSTGAMFWPTMIALMEPGSLLMERKMLLGIKERAEHLAFERHLSDNRVA